MTEHRLAIADLASELADPHQHREPRWGWTRTRKRTRLRDHITVQPGLVTQLHAAISPLLSGWTDGGAQGVPRSAPPLQIDALDRYLDIRRGANTWAFLFGVQRRTWPLPKPEETIRALVGANHGDRAGELLADMHRWRNWAATLTGWQSIYVPNAACPVLDCGGNGTLRVNLDRPSAICIACRSWWDETTVSILAEHIANTTDGHETIRVRSGRSGHGGWSSREPKGAPSA